MFFAEVINSISKTLKSSKEMACTKKSSNEAKPYDRPLMGPPSIKLEHKMKKLEHKKREQLLAAIKRGGYTLFTETDWSGYERLAGRTLVMDKGYGVWECVNESFDCLAFVGAWSDIQGMVPIELCNDEE